MQQRLETLSLLAVPAASFAVHIFSYDIVLPALLRIWKRSKDVSCLLVGNLWIGVHGVKVSFCLFCRIWTLYVWKGGNHISSLLRSESMMFPLFVEHFPLLLVITVKLVSLDDSFH